MAVSSIIKERQENPIPWMEFRTNSAWYISTALMLLAGQTSHVILHSSEILFFFFFYRCFTIKSLCILWLHWIIWMLALSFTLSFSIRACWFLDMWRCSSLCTSHQLPSELWFETPVTITISHMTVEFYPKSRQCAEKSVLTKCAAFPLVFTA